MKPIHILLVDDNYGDLIMVQEAIMSAGIAHSVDTAINGIEALSILKKENGFEKNKSPDLVLLDINMPRMDGYEFLDVVKVDDELKHIPIIMLSTSSLPEDIFKSYRKYANCYIVKPDNIADYESVIAGIENFWISVAKLPQHS